MTSLANDIRSEFEVCKNLARQRVDKHGIDLKPFFIPLNQTKWSDLAKPDMQRASRAT